MKCLSFAVWAVGGGDAFGGVSSSNMRHPVRSVRLAGSEAWLDGSKACLAGSWALEGGMDGWTDRWTDGQTDERTENLPILQDFIP